MPNWLDRIADLYQRDIVDPGKQPQLLILLAFLITFSLVRLLVHRIRSGHSRIHNLDHGGLHVHHLVWGILLLLTTGFLTISYEPDWPWRPLLAISFGVGAALTLDEFALWLHLQDVYWAKQGRQSVDAVIVATTLLLMVLLSNEFWWNVFELAVGVSEFESGMSGFGGDGGRFARPLAVAYPIFGLLTIVGMWKVLVKTGRRGWLAIVPIVNLVALVHAAGRRGWWAVLFLVPLVNIVVSVFVGEELARRFGRSRRFGIALGLLPPIFYLILGFSDDRYQGASPARKPTPTLPPVQQETPAAPPPA